MTNYNEQYCILARPRGEDQIFVGLDSRVSSDSFYYTKPNSGSPEFFFNNRAKKRQLKMGVKWPLTSAFVWVSNVMVDRAHYEALKDFNISNLKYHPSIYIDDEDVWHEDYWFLVFYQELDCWHRKRSEVLDKGEVYSDGTEFPPRLNKFYLDDKVLDPIPEEERLMFAMGGVSNRFIFVHQKIVDIFDRSRAEGVRFIKVSDFKDGDDIS